MEPSLSFLPIDLPSRFVSHNEVDPEWLSRLPTLVGQLAARWSLTLDRHFPEIILNYVAPAMRADGTPCVLKVSRYVDDTENEIAALRLWDGDGAARLLDADAEIGALLLERLEPGGMLVEVAEADDDDATLIAAQVLAQLWRPVSERHGLRSLESWCVAFDRNRAALSRGADGFPSTLFQRADAMRADLLASTERHTVLHGDMHHFNVLRATRAPWLAIDPKGLAGDRCFDVCQFLRNPKPVPPGVNARRLDLFCAELGLERARTKEWAFVHAMLDACWAYENGEPWQDKVAYAESTQSF